MMTKLAIIIPAYNEAEVIASTLARIKLIAKHYLPTTKIIVIDDGSFDKTGSVARRSGATVLTHRFNCGLGAALTTGIEYAKRHGFSYAITFDADGQHDPADLIRSYRRLKSGYDLLIGSRFLGKHYQMPLSRRIVLNLSNLLTYLFFGVWTTDSQSGFRALGPRAIAEIALQSSRMEVSSEFFGEIKKRSLRFAEIPISVRYTDYSLGKGQKNSASLSVLLKLLYLLGR